MADAHSTAKTYDELKRVRFGHAGPWDDGVDGRLTFCRSAWFVFDEICDLAKRFSDYRVGSPAVAAMS